ncbi:hypothetical protein [Zavarzinella formosa]|uniref:hypothetical protein n=1 Tax=Zavarzinella formosa TaxID=360055 RepID=UPI00036B883A|nr:hypothetical protein [Zavarzinella formosa]
MTEAEWLACADPKPMLNFIRGKASDRKLRLFACGCCRVVWDWLVSPRSQEAVLASEAYADGLCSDEDLHTYNFRAEGAVFAIDEKEQKYRWEQRGIDIGWLLEEDRVEDEEIVCANGMRISYHAARIAANAAEFATSSFNEFLTHANPEMLSEPITRCIFGNPFHLVTIDPAWLTFDVRMIAAGSYEDRAFNRLPILADALQDAGCDNDDILSHLRDDGMHVRGCWALDLILGKS